MFEKIKKEIDFIFSKKDYLKAITILRESGYYVDLFLKRLRTVVSVKKLSI